MVQDDCSSSNHKNYILKGKYEQRKEITLPSSYDSYIHQFYLYSGTIFQWKDDIKIQSLFWVAMCTHKMRIVMTKARNDDLWGTLAVCVCAHPCVFMPMQVCEAVHMHKWQEAEMKIE